MPVILFAVFIDLLGFGIIVPVLPFIVLNFGGDSVSGMALVSIYSLAAFIMGPIWGRFSDKFGRKPALAGTFLGATISYITLGMADTLLLLFLARAMSGAMAGNIGIVMAAMADVTTEENRGKAIGWIGAAFGLGFALGPGIGGILSTIGGNGDPNIFWAGMTAACLSFTAMILTTIFVPETNKKKTENEDHKDVPRWTSVFKQPGQTALLAMFIVTAIGQSISFAITPFWAERVLGWNSAQVGYLLMASGVCVFFIQLFAIGPLFKKFGEVKSLGMALGFHLIGVAIILYGPAEPITAILGFPIIMSGMTLTFPALNSLVSRRTDERLQGTALGISNGLSSLGRIAGPITAGTVFTASVAAPFYIIASTGILVIFWTVWELSARPSHIKAPAE
ncbi:MFS transporter [Kordiimonas sp. SCSIO 12603]|uniref:MFS transporter n=1 Tax=Kordiimonas sp. SCSIO 12603 TaxID=2829596 RepID=UPI0021058F0C|nr:MFS transporter [Kordiimonas sp. SCSIO 12603]UTW58505.1 MFS transporter [Kordiimonas sp. SCSIO 12603]